MHCPAQACAAESDEGRAWHGLWPIDKHAAAQSAIVALQSSTF